MFPFPALHGLWTLRLVIDFDFFLSDTLGPTACLAPKHRV